MTETRPAVAAVEHAGSRLRTGAWILYDLANTVYAATLTFLFTPYCEEHFKALTGLGVVQTTSMVLAGFLVPLCGAITDRTVRTRTYLAIATLLCILAMAGWVLEGSQAWMLGCFFVANVTYNLGLVFYNTLLPSVATEERVGLVSGIGVGVGYFGTILVVLALLPLQVASHQFLAAAAMFLVGALPCLLLVHDRRQPVRGSAPVVREALGSLSRTLRELPAHRPLMWFLLANFCLVDVLNTAVLFFASFTKNVFASSAHDGTLQLFGHVYLGDDGLKEFFGLAGLCLNSLALVFGIALGALTDRRPLQVMRWSGIGLFIALAGGAWFGGSSALGYLLTLVLFGAAGLSGIWTAGRKIVVMLAPRERLGEFFGLYGITMKLSVLGSTVYGLVADTFGTKPAMLAQSAQLLIGLGCLAMVRIPERRDLRT